jgi:hypothetical protein
MSYDPEEQRITLKQVLAGWILCLTFVGVAFVATGRHGTIPAADASARPHPIAAAWCPVRNARIPYFALCATEQRVAAARGPLSLPTNPCG